MGTSHGLVTCISSNVALMSTLLCLGCFALAMALRKFRGSNFLTSSIRRMIGDFGVPISILIFVIIDLFLGDVDTEKLKGNDNIFSSFTLRNRLSTNYP